MKCAHVDKITEGYNFTSYALVTTIEHSHEVKPNPLLKRVLNQDASIKVGDSIFVFQNNKEIIIEDAKLKKYQKFYNILQLVLRFTEKHFEEVKFSDRRAGRKMRWTIEPLHFT